MLVQLPWWTRIIARDNHAPTSAKQRGKTASHKFYADLLGIFSHLLQKHLFHGLASIGIVLTILCHLVLDENDVLLAGSSLARTGQDFSSNILVLTLHERRSTR